MTELKGKHNVAKIFTDLVDQGTLNQIKETLNLKAYADSKIRIMPDCHLGKGATIGTTMTITDKVAPSAVGVDIGCGMYVVPIAKSQIDFQKLDQVIRERIPSGMGNFRKEVHPMAEKVDLSKLKAPVDKSKALLSIGTLGSGNHFVEINGGEKHNYLVIHSGSRGIGASVAKYYIDLAVERTKGYNSVDIGKMKLEGRHSEIADALKSRDVVPKDLSFLTGDDLDDYLHDIKILQFYAEVNRVAMASEILHGMGWTAESGVFQSVHNYIDIENRILRKGATSAQLDETLIIPINMRDGSLICEGLGNPDWNYSAPHGAGRLMSRNEAKSKLSVDDFKNEMSCVFSTTVNQETLDEAPGAYKPIESILENIQDTVRVIEHIRPLYNFKGV